MSGREGAGQGLPIDLLAGFMMVGLTLSWGFNQVAIKLGNSGYSPIFAMCVRSLIGTILVYLWCRYRKIALFTRDGTLKPGLLIGALFGLEFLLIFPALELTNAARGTLMLNTMPFWVLLGGHFLLGEKITVRKFIGLILAFAGVVILFSDKLSAPGPYALLGDVLCLFGGFLWAATIIVIKQSSLSEAPAEKTLLYQLAVSTLMALPIIPFAGPVLRDPDLVSTAALAFQSIYVVSFTYLLWFWLMRRYQASGLSSFAFLTPAFGVLSGALILEEPVTWRMALTLVLVALGLVIVNRPRRRVVPG